MAIFKGRPGGNIRALALYRRWKALGSFIGAGVTVYLPFALARFTRSILEPLQRNNPDAAQGSAIPVGIYVFCFIAAAGLVANGLFWWRRANHADQGARGEEDMAQVLQPLAKSGWRMEYGRRLGKGVGDVDIICTSPKGNVYAIDVKSHRGLVISDGKQLNRQMGKQRYQFEKDFLAQATKQALAVKQALKVDFVTPVVAFSNAQVAKSLRRVRQVQVVEKQGLVKRLQELEQRPKKSVPKTSGRKPGGPKHSKPSQKSSETD